MRNKSVQKDAKIIVICPLVETVNNGVSEGTSFDISMDSSSPEYKKALASFVLRYRSETSYRLQVDSHSFLVFSHKKNIVESFGDQLSRHDNGILENVFILQWL